MPSNTDNSGSARAARLRRINAAQGPAPNSKIGSIALDRTLAPCCDVAVPPPEPQTQVVLVCCGIESQVLDPTIYYGFLNNTPDTFTFEITYEGGNTEYIEIPPFDFENMQDTGRGPYVGLTSWNSVLENSCSSPLVIGVFPLSFLGCPSQVLDPTKEYQFQVLGGFGDGDITLTLEDSSTVPLPVDGSLITIPSPTTGYITWTSTGDCAYFAPGLRPAFMPRKRLLTPPKLTWTVPSKPAPTDGAPPAPPL